MEVASFFACEIFGFGILFCGKKDITDSGKKLQKNNYLIHSQRQMKIGKYFLERTIGKGNFAVVKLATHCDTHQKVIEIEGTIEADAPLR